jgi:tRNA(Ile)-lysidine synthase
MVLLDACMAYRRSAVVAVATFDHGTGPAASAAVALVERTCLEHGLPVVSGRLADGRQRMAVGSGRSADGVKRTAYSFPSAGASRPTEASWRADRWRFLRAVAAEHGATIVTAHTLDDQAETVAMRILRGASARGLAAMAARVTGIVRPLLGVPRVEVATYAAEHGVRFVHDPSNTNPGHLRNRLRTDLLRAAVAVRPEFVAELCAIGDRAAVWRRDLAEVVDTMEVQQVGEALVVASSALDGIDLAGRAVIWPELAGRLGLTMDRRGVARAAQWSVTARAGQQMPLSGGACIERTARTFVIRPA